jgi:hypothetical protein
MAEGCGFGVCKPVKPGLCAAGRGAGCDRG